MINSQQIAFKWYNPNNNYAHCNQNTPGAKWMSQSEAANKRKHWYNPNNNYAHCNQNTQGAKFLSATEAGQKRNHWCERLKKVAMLLFGRYLPVLSPNLSPMFC